MTLSNIIYILKLKLRKIELSFLIKRVNNFNLQLVDKESLKDSEVIVYNYFNTDFKKNALISYIIYPFIGEIQHNHSNHRECYAMAEVLRELEFNVDIINWDNYDYVPVKTYDIVIDNHNNLERLQSFLSLKTLKIYHATNTYWMYQNWIEFGRYYEFFLETGNTISPPRIIERGNSVSFCDAITMFGNDFTKNTYGRYRDKVYQIPISVTTKVEGHIDKDFFIAKSKFIWLNSHGALLKGLDIVLKAFIMLPHLELYICGDLDKEPDFFKSIAPMLNCRNNIKFLGWIDTEGEEFLQLTKSCAWILNTSFSEGGGGSTLNCMAKGLIPIVSRESSISIRPKFGFCLLNNTVGDLVELLNGVTELSNVKLKELSHSSCNFIKENHTLENFKLKYKACLESLILSQINSKTS